MYAFASDVNVQDVNWPGAVVLVALFLAIAWVLVTIFK